jgi:hypothetical protein
MCSTLIFIHGLLAACHLLDDSLNSYSEKLFGKSMCILASVNLCLHLHGLEPVSCPGIQGE